MIFGLTPSFSKKQMIIINAKDEEDKNPYNDPEHNPSYWEKDKI
jgi:hypothetical protein